jgi:transposase InsO family protein
MPWRELSIMDQREEFVRLALTHGANRSELCHRFGISRSKGYKWLARYRTEGLLGLADRSRRPQRSPARTSEAVEAEVLRIRAASNNAWGGRKIAHMLSRSGAPEVPAPSTITAILRRHGNLDERSHEHPGPYRRFEHAEPNDLWQMDFKGHFATGRGRCHPLTVLDDHSRYALGLEACADEQDKTARQRLVSIFRRYGLPVAMLMDNGPPWGDGKGNGDAHTCFTVWLMRLGIKVSHGRPYHPQTQGKDERFHRSLKAEVLTGKSFIDLAQCQHAFDRWRPIYNRERPHEAIGLAVPADRYRMSPRPYPEELPAIEYGPGDHVRKVDMSGEISFKHRPWRIGLAFRGQYIALRSTAEDGIFSVHYAVHRLGSIDLKRPVRGVCGLVDNAARCPQGPQEQQHQHVLV